MSEVRNDTPGRRLTEIDEEFARACLESRVLARMGFEEWMLSVHIPVRLTLRRFARVVDVEHVVQETLMRMWRLSRAQEHPSLEGEDASLRYAIDMARAIATSEAREGGLEDLLPPEDMAEMELPTHTPPSPELREVIMECTRKLSRRPHDALRIRLITPWRPDHENATFVGMTTDVFLQNLVQARKQIVRCLERKGIKAEGCGHVSGLFVKHPGRECPVEAAVAAYREEDRDGRLVPSAAWRELAPEERESLYLLQLAMCQLAPFDLGTVMAIWARVSRAERGASAFARGHDRA